NFATVPTSTNHTALSVKHWPTANLASNVSIVTARSNKCWRTRKRKNTADPVMIAPVFVTTFPMSLPLLLEAKQLHDCLQRDAVSPTDLLIVDLCNETAYHNSHIPGA